MKKRKTIEVKALIEMVNTKLALETISQVEKSAICHVLERILHDTGNYKGYNCNFAWNDIPIEQATAKQYTRHYY